MNEFFNIPPLSIRGYTRFVIGPPFKFDVFVVITLTKFGVYFIVVPWVHYRCNISNDNASV